MLVRVVPIAAFVLNATPVAAQTNYDTVQVRIAPVSGSVYMLVGAGGNIAVSVGNDPVLMVDDQLAPLTKKHLAAIAELTPNPVRFVVNTHWHTDHTGGNENLGKAGAALYAHENVRRRMSTEQFVEAQNRRFPPSPRGALPVALKDTVFHLNGDSITVRHVPRAHTDGDLIVHFTKSNVFHMGDVFNNTGLPFVDLSSGGSIHGVIAAADSVLAKSDAETRIIPGHGPLANRERLKAYRDMLATLRDRVRTLISTGKTVEQILELNIGAPFAKDFPAGHTRFVRVAHQELSRR